MTLSVNPSWEGSAAPRHSEVISPELALVDPVLAASARASLPEPRATPSARVVAPGEVGAGRSRALAALSDAALAMDDEFVKPVTGGRSWRVLVGVAAVTILSLLLFDVRVQVGKTPASAETSQAPPTSAETSQVPPTSAETSQVPPTAPSPLVRPPRASVPRPEHENAGERAIKPSARRFAWAPAPGASGYRIEFFKGAMLAFSANTTRPQLTVPARWTEAEKTRSFVSGEYRWYVWPVISGARASRAIVQARLVIR